MDNKRAGAKPELKVSWRIADGEPSHLWLALWSHLLANAGEKKSIRTVEQCTRALNSTSEKDCNSNAKVDHDNNHEQGA